MGGKLKDDECVVGGVVEIGVRDYLDKLVRLGKFESRSKAIGHILTQHTENHSIKEEP